MRRTTAVVIVAAVVSGAGGAWHLGGAGSASAVPSWAASPVDAVRGSSEHSHDDEPDEPCPRGRDDTEPPGRHGGLTRTTAARWARAQQAARAAEVELVLRSGWRSLQRQQELWDCALEREGSAERARRWVLPPEESEHVRGRALDVGPANGAEWLAANGWRFGLCQRYANEPWHFEPLSTPGERCPRLERHP